MTNDVSDEAVEAARVAFQDRSLEDHRSTDERMRDALCAASPFLAGDGARNDKRAAIANIVIDAVKHVRQRPAGLRGPYVFNDEELDRLIALSAPPPQPPQHPDDAAVDRFAVAMKSKLKWEREERGRHGWNAPNVCSTEYLSTLLWEHLPKGDPVDVANLAMMLHQRGERIAAPPPQPEVAGLVEAPLMLECSSPDRKPWVELRCSSLDHMHAVADVVRAALASMDRRG